MVELHQLVEKNSKLKLHLMAKLPKKLKIKLKIKLSQHLLGKTLVKNHFFQQEEDQLPEQLWLLEHQQLPPKKSHNCLLIPKRNKLKINLKNQLYQHQKLNLRLSKKNTESRLRIRLRLRLRIRLRNRLCNRLRIRTKLIQQCLGHQEKILKTMSLQRNLLKDKPISLK